MRHFLLLGVLAAFFLGHSPARAAVRQEWVQHFDGGFPAKASQPVAMQMDSAGNIYVVGSAANSSNLLDYAALKYNPNGTLFWSKRYGSTNGLSNIPRAIGLDTNDNLYITGTSVTVKYSTDGEELWTAPYGGRGLAVQGTNLFVTGFSSANFATVSLFQDGTPQWIRIRRSTWPAGTYSLNVFVGPNQRILVVGRETFYQDRTSYYTAPFLVIYNQHGEELAATVLAGGANQYQGLTSVYQGASGILYLSGAIAILGDGAYYSNFQCMARAVDGAGIWDFAGFNGENSITTVVESDRFVYAAGSFGGDAMGHDYFGLDQIKPDGTLGWSVRLLGVVQEGMPGTVGLSESISLGTGGQPCVTGYVPSISAGNNIATAKYDTNGTLLWAQQYNGAANGHDEGKAIVADSAGNVYVAGLSSTPEGGTEIVLIKFSEYTSIEKSPSGSMLLQFPGTPGQPYKVQASTNFPNWRDIGLGTAAPNGLLQFEDTNATQYPFRFYQTVTPTP